MTTERDMPARPRTRAEVESALAQAAFERGAALLASGDTAAARPWLERARRIAPQDDSVALSLALALLRLNDPGALALFESLARRHDAQGIWLGLAAARRRAGDMTGAAAALAQAFSHHRLTDAASIAAEADRIAAGAGVPGWCAVGADGAVLVHPLAGAGRVRVLADGRPLLGRRKVPAGARQVRVLAEGRELLGSPVEVARFTEVEGCVAATPEGGIEGWAWHPADPGRAPRLTIVPARGPAPWTVLASEDTPQVMRPLTRPRRFAIPAAALAGCEGPVSVRGPDGRDLAGSPLDPGLERRAARAVAQEVARALPALGRGRPAAVPWQPMPVGLVGPPAVAPRHPRRPVVVVIPVYRGFQVTQTCLTLTRATVAEGTRLIVVDDASPEPALAAWLDAEAQAGRITLIRHARNQGFPAAANTGLRAAARLPGGADVVLLNSDAAPTPGWLARLRRAVHAAPDIGTACPLSNDATILSYPDPHKPAPPPEGAALRELASLAAEALPDAVVDIPTAVGFCMYIRRECLIETGLLRTDLFAQGYGEENDFCLRARHLGWRHVAVPGTYVAHWGGESFGAARASLMARNLEVLERLHPGYRDLIAAWQAADPLAPARRALDAARWAARPSAPGAVLIVTHDSGGGVERAVRERCAALAAQGVAAILLRPVVARTPDPQAPERRYRPNLCLIGEPDPTQFPNLRFHLPDELPALVALLRPSRPARMEVHHVIGHHHSVIELAARLAIPYEVHVHDYAWLCPRVTLVGRERRYCGEPEVSVCEACVADLGSDLEEEIGPRALRARSAAELAGAARVVAPSADAAARLHRYFPSVRAEVVPHETDTGLPRLRPLPPVTPGGAPRRVGVIGAIGTAKGYDLLLACARDAASRNLPLSFTVIGYTEDDDPLLETGRVFITGPYREEEAVALVQAQRVDLAWVPSVCPETWCYALGVAFRTGLAAVAFDLGAQAERIRRTGRGWLLPLGLPPASLNNALLTLQVQGSDVSLAAKETSVPAESLFLPART